MSLSTLEEIASYIVSEGRGILAADESNPTCGKRFDSIGVESNEDNRRDYREMLFRSSGMKDNIGGVILLMKPLDKMLKTELFSLILFLIKAPFLELKLIKDFNLLVI